MLATAATPQDTQVKDDGGTRIPYRLADARHIPVRAKVNGKGSYNFILDTGAPVTLKSNRPTEVRGLKPGGQFYAI